MHLPERVLQQFSYPQSVHRLPSQSTDLTATRPPISLHYVKFLDQVFTIEQRGPTAIFEATSQIRYFKDNKYLDYIC
jgi:hypothetical protein